MGKTIQTPQCKINIITIPERSQILGKRKPLKGAVLQGLVEKKLWENLRQTHNSKQ
jgi:hypothetical protein